MKLEPCFATRNHFRANSLQTSDMLKLDFYIFFVVKRKVGNCIVLKINKLECHSASQGGLDRGDYIEGWIADILRGVYQND